MDLNSGASPKKLARSYYRAETLAEVNYSDFENFV